MDHAFGTGAPFTVGIEEELMLVDPETHALAPVAARVLGEIASQDGFEAAHEVYAAQIELRSPPAATADGAVRALRAGRAAARAAGATLLGAGIHPAAELGDAPIVDADRYRRCVADMRGLMQRTPEAALHVHVGMPDPDAAIRAFNCLRAQLPLVQALAAGSPYWFGRDSGLASARFFLTRGYPARGVPPAFRDLGDYEEHLRSLAAGGGPDDYTLVWWDVRPHPRLGTVELRELDAQASLDDDAAIAALVRALAVEAAEGRAPDPPPREAIEWSAFRAARDGLDAEVLHDGSPAPVREVARAVVGRLRGTGSDPALDGVERILRDGGSADRQRAAHARGGMPALLAHLVEATAAA
ncbi:MAG TPA: YbdK family carboxylate-amine ligase [Thermoleophilaceae bacterium]